MVNKIKFLKICDKMSERILENNTRLCLQNAGPNWVEKDGWILALDDGYISVQLEYQMKNSFIFYRWNLNIPQEKV